METSLPLPKPNFPEIFSILNYAVIIYLYQLRRRFTYIEKKIQGQCLNKIEGYFSPTVGNSMGKAGSPTVLSGPRHLPAFYSLNVSYCYQKGGVQLLGTPKPINRPGWWKGKFALFQTLATGGVRVDMCPKADSPPLKTSGTRTCRLREGATCRNSTVRSDLSSSAWSSAVWPGSSWLC